ncbi:MAG: hypothetical protein ACLQT6_11630 [Desulfomonilaceae bacterium]
MAIISLGEELANRIFCELYKGKNVGDFSDGCSSLRSLGFKPSEIDAGINDCLDRRWLRKPKTEPVLTEEGFRVVNSSCL